MDRQFIYKSEKYHKWFCGKCGKGILPDLYNAQKHARECGFICGEDKYTRNIISGDDRIYRLRAEEDGLHLEICRPELINIPGFTDRFRGIRLITELETVLSPDCKEPEILKNETGIPLDIWLSLIRTNKIRPVHKERDIEVIRLVFPGIIWLYSLQMFFHIYRTKGFHYRQLLSEPMAKRILLTPPDYSDFIEPDDPALCGMKSDPDGFPLDAVILENKDSDLILKITADTSSDRPASILVSRGYTASYPEIYLPGLIEKSYRLTKRAADAILRFSAYYPEFNLEQYMKTSSNVFIPLLAPDYHCLLELSAKAAVPAIAENMRRLKQFEMDPSVCKNLQQAFNLPLHVLRALRPKDVRKELLEQLAEIQKYRPGFLQFDKYTPSMCDFYQGLQIKERPCLSNFKLDKNRRDCIFKLDGLAKRDYTDAQLMQILRYLYKRNASWQYLKDYLHGCELLHEYPYGITPKGSLADAHNEVMHRVYLKKDALKDFRFKSVVTSPSYISLTTNDTEEDQEFFKEDPFIIIPPEKQDDLFAESAHMNNCVKLYTDLVTSQTTKIYFLRRKNAPSDSFGTIEVRGKNLVQAKGFGNSRLKDNAQAFILKWCRAKHLSIRTHDITT